MSIQTLGSSPKAEFSGDKRKEMRCLTFHALFSQLIGVSGGDSGVGSVDEADFATAEICFCTVRIRTNNFLRSSSESMD